jgi:HEAT repeat protein
MRKRFERRRAAFAEKRRERIERIKSRRSRTGPGLTSLERTEEKPGIAARAEMDQFGKEKPAAVEDLEGADPRTVIDEVMTALDDPDPEVREEALEALEGVDDEAINGPLLKALADENADVRESAMDLMEDIQSANILPSLEQALVAGDDDMREDALFILEDIPDPRAVDLIIEKGLLNYNQNISQEAFDSLEWITDQEFKSYNEAYTWWEANRDTFQFDQ